MSEVGDRIKKKKKMVLANFVFPRNKCIRRALTLLRVGLGRCLQLQFPHSEGGIFDLGYSQTTSYCGVLFVCSFVLL